MSSPRERAAPRRSAGHGTKPHDETRARSREAIARSADLQRRYAAEYASILRVIGDREVAREAARVNVSALLVGQSRIVPVEGRFAAGQLLVGGFLTGQVGSWRSGAMESSSRLIHCEEDRSADGNRGDS